MVHIPCVAQKPTIITTGENNAVAEMKAAAFLLHLLAHPVPHNRESIAARHQATSKAPGRQGLAVAWNDGVV